MFFPFHDDNPTERTPVVTGALIALNVLGFLWVQRLPPGDRQIVGYTRGFVPARIDTLAHPRPIKVVVQRQIRHPVHGLKILRREALVLQPVPRQVFASLLTCMFLHGGWMHLIGNMWFLWIFGNNVEDRLGMGAFIVLYLAGGLFASGCHWAFNPGSTTPVIGASGAVAAVLGAYAITWPWARVHTLVVLIVFFTIIDLPALFVLGAWFVYQLFAAQQSLAQGAATNVAWWAHVGGFVAGLVLMPALSVFGHAATPRSHRQTEIYDDDPY